MPGVCLPYLPVFDALHDDSSDEENCSDFASNMDLDDSSDNRVETERTTHDFLFFGPDISSLHTILLITWL